MGCRTLKSPTALSTKNDTYETLCVTLNQIIYVDYEPVHHA